MDSGNNKHHCLQDMVFFPRGVKYITLAITGAHGKKDVEVGIGTAEFTTKCKDGTIAEWSFPNSLYNPKSPVNLMCMDLFHYKGGDPYNKTGNNVDFSNETVNLHSGRSCPLPRHPQSRLYHLDIAPRVFSDNSAAVLFKNTQLRALNTRTAIERLGFPNEERFNITLKNKMIGGIDHLKPAPTRAAAKRGDAWYAGKLTQRHIASSSERVPTRPGSDIYSDVVGPFPVPTREGHIFFVLYKCSFTQHVAIYLMKSKDQLLDTWKQYIKDMRNFSEAKSAMMTGAEWDNLSQDEKDKQRSEIVPGILHYPEDPQFLVSDDEQIYVKGGFQQFNLAHMVGQWTIAPYTHSACPAEPEVRRVVEAATSALHKSGLPPSFMLYACLHVVYGGNITYTSVHYTPEDQYKTPHERRLKCKPHIDEVPAFGCKAHVNVHKTERGKGGLHHWVGFYVGPSHNMKGYRVYRPLLNKCYDRYHVVFDTNVTYGDFMGDRFKERVRSDRLQREHYNREVDVLLGLESSNPLLDLLLQPGWAPLPDPAQAAAAAATEQQHLPPAAVPPVPPPAAAVAPVPPPAAAVPPVPQLQAATPPQTPPPVRPAQARAAIIPPVPAPLAAALPVLDPMVIGNLGEAAPIQAAARLQQEMFELTPPPRVTRARAALATNAVARNLLEGVPTASPAAVPAFPPLQEEQPQRIIEELRRPEGREAMLLAASAASALFTESFGDEHDHEQACMLFADADFLDDINSTDMDDLGISLLQLLADGSYSETCSFLAAPAPPLNARSPPDETRLHLDDETSKRIAKADPPATPGQIRAPDGTTEGHLIREAQVDEVLSMIRENRVRPVDIRTLGQNVYQINGKWVIKYKKTLENPLERVRARWTLRGDLQVPHRDYDPDEIYSPVASKATHFTLFVIAVQYGLLLYCLDVSKAFMMGPIDKAGIYMRPPFGFSEQVHPDFCPFGEYTTYELLCSLYGLKQAAAVYYKTVKALVLKFIFPDGSKFLLSPADPCLFVHGSPLDTSDSYIAFSLHIDDKFIACKTVADRDVVSSIFDEAKWKYTLETMEKVLGVTVKYRRWIQVTGDGGTLELSHSSYIKEIYEKNKHFIPKEECSPRTLPIASSTVSSLTKLGANSLEDYDSTRHTTYRSILGAVGHVANFTHPEIAFAVSFASQFMSNPSSAHLSMVFGILLYLYNNADVNIIFNRQSQPFEGNPICIACDSDLGNSHKRGRSRSGITAYLFGNLVYWCSRLQPSVSLSTAEAEYMALAAAGRFAVWYKMLVGDLGIQECYTLPANIFSDNKSCIRIATSPITNKHSRHIDRRLHWMREKTTKQGPLQPALRIGFIGTDDNVSDAMTKGNSSTPFRSHRDKLMHGFKFIEQLRQMYRSGSTDFKSFYLYLQRDIDMIMLHDFERDIDMM